MQIDWEKNTLGPEKYKVTSISQVKYFLKLQNITPTVKGALEYLLKVSVKSLLKTDENHNSLHVIFHFHISIVEFLSEAFQEIVENSNCIKW